MRQFPEEIIKLYQSGSTLIELGKKYNCKSTLIRSFLISKGIEIKQVRNFAQGKEDKILELYNQNLPMQQIANQLGISRKTIRNFFKKHNLDNTRFVHKKQEDIYAQSDEIVAVYESGKTLAEVAVQFNCDDTTVYRIVKQVKKVRPKRIYTINEDYFDQIDTKNKAYILGFWYADGNVQIEEKGKPHYSIRMEIADLDILEEMKTELGYSGPLILPRKRSEKHKQMYILSIRSEKLAKDLIKWGCVPNKTFKLEKIPNIPQELISHFIRGYFDGDGCVSYQTANICGNLPFLKDIFNYINVKYSLYDNSKNTFVQIFMNQHGEARKFMDFIYKDCQDSLKLDRKYQKYLNPIARTYNKEVEKRAIAKRKVKRQLSRNLLDVDFNPLESITGYN